MSLIKLVTVIMWLLCTDGLNFLVPLKHRMLYEAFSNYVGEHDYQVLFSSVKLKVETPNTTTLKLW